MIILSFITSLCTIGAIIFLFFWDRKRGKEIAALQAENEGLKSAISELAEKHEALSDKFKAADELIEAAKEREVEAVRSEKLFQDGINSIVNYDYMTAMKGKCNGER